MTETIHRRKLLAALAVLFLINVLLILFAQSADAATYRQGSRGENVKSIQRILKQTGHYAGSVDGIYGPRTVSAVRAFQKSCGLTVDGICGPVTLKYLGLGHLSASTAGGGSGAASYQNDRALLARIISAEARGEPYTGQVAVGAVVLNRVKHPSFPGTLSGVIYQPGAFSAILDGQFNMPIADSAYRAADDALAGWDPSNGSIYYFNPATATSSWIWSRPQVLRIGRHTFCK